ncbi:MAG: hypothetical protein EVA35_03435, partial [Candidatus Poseidoniales archaeon]
MTGGGIGGIPGGGGIGGIPGGGGMLSGGGKGISETSGEACMDVFFTGISKGDLTFRIRSSSIR